MAGPWIVASDGRINKILELMVCDLVSSITTFPVSPCTALVHPTTCELGGEEYWLPHEKVIPKKGHESA
jgi:hypothetical protein